MEHQPKHYEISMKSGRFMRLDTRDKEPVEIEIDRQTAVDHWNNVDSRWTLGAYRTMIDDVLRTS